MEVQAALGSDIALAFDECTPFHVERDYTARSMERTHRWLDRCVAWHGEHAPARPAAATASCRAACTRTCAPSRRAYVAGAGVDGIAIGGSLGQSKEQMREVVEWSLRGLPRRARRGTCSGSATWTTSSTRSGAGIDTFDCATPTRLAATAPRSCTTRTRRWRLDLTKSAAPHEPRADRPRTARARPAASTRAATCTT